MKRRLLIIVLFLLLGAVVNVAVAWSLVLAVKGTPWIGSSVAPMSSYEALAVWREYVGELGPSITIQGTRSKRFGIVFTDLYFIHPESPYIAPGYTLLQAGWPTRCMEGSYGDDSKMWYVRSGTVPVGVGVRWPLFALNTLFYAAILWFLIPGPFVLRRFLRLRRGLCPKCAYPMGESAVCSECGVELPLRPAAT